MNQKIMHRLFLNDKRPQHSTFAQLPRLRRVGSLIYLWMIWIVARRGPTRRQIRQTKHSYPAVCGQVPLWGRHRRMLETQGS